MQLIQGCLCTACLACCCRGGSEEPGNSDQRRRYAMADAEADGEVVILQHKRRRVAGEPGLPVCLPADGTGWLVVPSAC